MSSERTRVTTVVMMVIVRAAPVPVGSITTTRGACRSARPAARRPARRCSGSRRRAGARRTCARRRRRESPTSGPSAVRMPACSSTMTLGTRASLTPTQQPSTSSPSPRTRARRRRRSAMPKGEDRRWQASRTTPKSRANATTSAAATRQGPSDQRPDPLRGALPERAEPEPVADGAGRDVDHHDALQEGAGDDRQGDGHEHERAGSRRPCRRGCASASAVVAPSSRDERQREEGHHDGGGRDRRDELHDEPAAERGGGIAPERAEGRPEQGAEAQRAQREEAGLRRRRPAAGAGGRTPGGG